MRNQWPPRPTTVRSSSRFWAVPRKIDRLRLRHHRRCICNASMKTLASTFPSTHPPSAPFSALIMVIPFRLYRKLSAKGRTSARSLTVLPSRPDPYSFRSRSRLLRRSVVQVRHDGRGTTTANDVYQLQKQSALASERTFVQATPNMQVPVCALSAIS